MRQAVIVAVLAVLAGVLGCGGVSVTGMAGSPEQKAVRKWLKENTPSGRWEEIEWKGPAAFNGNTYMWLKYRTKNKLGALAVEKGTFRIEENGVTNVSSDYYDIQHEAIFSPEAFAKEQADRWKDYKGGPQIDFDMDSDGDPNN